MNDKTTAFHIQYNNTWENGIARYCEKSHDYCSKCDELFSEDKLVINCSECIEKVCGFCKKNHEDLCGCGDYTHDNLCNSNYS